MPPTPPPTPAPAAPSAGAPTGPRPQVHAPTLWVERTFPTGTSFEERNLEARLFPTTPASVSAKLGRTINTGNYESVRLDVGLTLPCYAEEAEAALHHVSELAGKFLAQEEAAIRRMLADAGRAPAAPAA